MTQSLEYEQLAIKVETTDRDNMWEIIPVADKLIQQYGFDRHSEIIQSLEYGILRHVVKVGADSTAARAALQQRFFS